MDIGFYNEHGYIHIQNVIPEEYLQTAREKGKPLVEWSRENVNKPALAGPPTLNLHVGCAGAYEGELMNLYTSKFSYDLATTLLQKEDIYLFNDQMVYKFPNDNFTFAAHYDNQYGAENKDGNMHTVNMSWILDDFTDQNGTLELQSLKTKEWTRVYPKAGDIIAINGNCLHRSGPNESDKPRGLYACVYSEGQINLGNYYNEPFLLKDTETQHLHHLSNGIPVQQFKGFEKYFSKFLEINKFDRILELGTSRGGLTYFLSTIFDGPIITVDNETKYIDQKVYNVARVMKADHMSFETQQFLHKEFISKEGKTLVLCDGGDKPSIFNAFAALIKDGDFIGVHDFFVSKEEYEKQNAWNWMECSEDQIKNVIKEYKLEKTDTYLLNIVWGMYKKNTDQIKLPKHSSII